MRNLVLIAHADPLRLESLADALDAAGYRCLTALTGGDALATAASYGPQLAIVHVDLPDVQGTDVCLRLKQEPGTAATALLLIGKDSTQERFVGTEVGADAYLAEDAGEEIIVAKVRDLFRTLVLNARSPRRDTGE